LFLLSKTVPTDLARRPTIGSTYTTAPAPAATSNQRAGYESARSAPVPEQSLARQIPPTAPAPTPRHSSSDVNTQLRIAHSSSTSDPWEDPPVPRDYGGSKETTRSMLAGWAPTGVSTRSPEDAAAPRGYQFADIEEAQRSLAENARRERETTARDKESRVAEEEAEVIRLRRAQEDAQAKFLQTQRLHSQQKAERNAEAAKLREQREAAETKERARQEAAREAGEDRQRDAATAKERASQQTARAEEARLREATAANVRAAREAEETRQRQDRETVQAWAKEQAQTDAYLARLREDREAKARQQLAREDEETAAKERATQQAAMKAQEARQREAAAAMERARHEAEREADETRLREERRAQQAAARKAEEMRLNEVAAGARARIVAETDAKLARLREQRQSAEARSRQSPVPPDYSSASTLEATRPAIATQRVSRLSPALDNGVAASRPAAGLPPPADHECMEGDETAVTVYGYRFQCAPDDGKQPQPGLAVPAVEVYAPSLRELSDAKTNRVSVRGWPAAEKYWGRAVDDLQAAMEKRLRDLDRWQRAEENNAAERATVDGTLRKMTAELEATRRADELAALRLRNLTTKQGAAHVRRDSPPEESKTDFPCGDVLLGVYRSAWSPFDAFACDVVDALAEYDPRVDVAKAFVHNVILPVFQATQAYVEGTILRKQERMVQLFGPAAQFTRRDSDDVAWQFFLFTQQLKMPAEIVALNDAAVQALIQETDASSGERSAPKSVVGLAQELLQEGVNAGRFARGLTVQQVVRHFLRLHTYAMLSDPRCYLHPAPGTRLAFSEKHCIEVLSPGVKRYGRIKEGDQVEVVLCGLYFDDPRAADARPKVPVMVRRLSASDAAN
jgi:hypothetical protein